MKQKKRWEAGWTKPMMDPRYKHNETTHVVKTFIYELDVSYAATLHLQN